MEELILGADHAGYALKTIILTYLQKEGYQVKDLGTYSDASVDYPRFAQAVAKEILENPKNRRGILICGTGMGMAIAANRYKGIRATPCYSEELATLARQHNNSNILCLGARIINETEAQTITATWLTTKSSKEDRHQRRVKEIDEC